MKQYCLLAFAILFCSALTIYSLTSGYEHTVDTRNGAIDNGSAKIKSPPIVKSTHATPKAHTSVDFFKKINIA